MEVHHHAHTPRKKWSHYFWEFLMLFLAVFCGFLAEYKLETTIEKHRETDYINGFVNNLKTDRNTLDSTIELNRTRLKYLDSLFTISKKNLSLPENTRQLYHCYFQVRKTFPNYIPSDASVLQLKNSGSFRLIKKTAVVDSILKYDERNRLIANRTELYQEVLQKSWEAAYPVMDLTIMRDTFYVQNQQLVKQPPAISSDAEKLKIFFNANLREAVIVNFYITFLTQQRSYIDRLLPFIKKEYRLD